MAKQFILAIDQGTTGTTCGLLDTQSWQLVATSNTEFTQHYPKADWVEHDLDDIWASLQSSLSAVLEKAVADVSQIIGIGITNQRETTCAYDKSGKALAKAIVWQDKRTLDYCHSLQNSHGGRIKKLTGLPTDPYFSASKMNWLLQHNEAVKKACDDGDLCLSTIDSYLIYRLSEAESFVTDSSNASRTLLFNIHQLTWDEELLSLFAVPKSVLPEVKPSMGKMAVTKGLSFLPDGIPIAAVLGDQQAALFGQAGFEQGDMKSTYGTGAFLLLNTGEQAVDSNKGLLTTIAYSTQDKTCYALEASCYIAGAAVQWLRDNLNFIDDSPEVESLANQSCDEDIAALHCFPFLSGLGSPYWKPEAKGALLGLTRKTNQADIARVVLEGISLAVDDLITTMTSELRQPVAKLRVDGGAVNNNLLMQMQANFSDIDILRPEVIETTGYGAALAAAAGLNLITLEQATSLWREDKVFSPNRQNNYAQDKKTRWKNTLSKLYL